MATLADVCCAVDSALPTKTAVLVLDALTVPVALIAAEIRLDWLVMSATASWLPLNGALMSSAGAVLSIVVPLMVAAPWAIWLAVIPKN